MRRKMIPHQLKNSRVNGVYSVLHPRVRPSCMLFCVRPTAILLHQSDTSKPQFRSSTLDIHPPLRSISWDCSPFWIVEIPLPLQSGSEGRCFASYWGASFELRKNRKAVYLDIPLPDNNRGWHFEWSYIENHGNSLPSRSGR